MNSSSFAQFITQIGPGIFDLPGSASLWQLAADIGGTNGLMLEEIMLMSDAAQDGQEKMNLARKMIENGVEKTIFDWKTKNGEQDEREEEKENVRLNQNQDVDDEIINKEDNDGLMTDDEDSDGYEREEIFSVTSNESFKSCRDEASNSGSNSQTLSPTRMRTRVKTTQIEIAIEDEDANQILLGDQSDEETEIINVSKQELSPGGSSQPHLPSPYDYLTHLTSSTPLSQTAKQYFNKHSQMPSKIGIDVSMIGKSPSRSPARSGTPSSDVYDKLLDLSDMTPNSKYSKSTSNTPSSSCSSPNSSPLKHSVNRELYLSERHYMDMNSGQSHVRLPDSCIGSSIAINASASITTPTTGRASSPHLQSPFSQRLTQQVYDDLFDENGI